MYKRGVFFTVIVFAFVFVCVVQVSATTDIFLTNSSNGSIIKLQDLEFISCIDEPHSFLQHQIVCLDNFFSIQVFAANWSNSCYISVINLEQFDCNSLSMESLYRTSSGDKKLSKTIKIDKVLETPARVLATQEWDGGWLTASSTAYSIWVLSAFGDKYQREINDAMLWLKNNREAATKCWYGPGTLSCSIDETARTLSYLKLSGVNDQYRIINDATVFLATKQNFIGAGTWIAAITATSDDTFCNISFGGTVLLDRFNITEDMTKQVSFTPKYGDAFNFTCDDDVKFSIIDNRSITYFSESFDSDSTKDYDDLENTDENEDHDAEFKIIRFKPACWSYAGDKWDECSKTVTMHALATDVPADQKAKGLEWLQQNLRSHEITGKFLDTSLPHYDSAMYLLAVSPSDKDVLNWILYTQNNDGSFGAGTDKIKILSTVVTIKALEKASFAQKDEVLRDAKHYISEKYLSAGYDDVKVDGGIFQILYNNLRSFLRLREPSITILKNDQPKTATLESVGPYGFTNVKYTSVGEIDASGPNIIVANKTTQVLVTPKITTAGNHTAYVILSGTSEKTGGAVDEIKRIYVQIQQDPIFSVAGKKSSYTVYDYSADFLFEVSQINMPEVSCNVFWDSRFLESSRSITFRKTGVVPLKVNVVHFKKGNMSVSGTLTCSLQNITKIYPVSAEFLVLDQIPFTLEPTSITTTDYQKEFAVAVKNNLDIPIQVQASLTTNEPLLEIVEPTVIVDAHDSSNIYVKTLFTKQDNVTIASGVKVSALDYESSMEILVAHSYTPISPEVIKWIIIGIIVAAVCAAGYLMRKTLAPAAMGVLDMLKGLIPKKIAQKVIPGKYIVNNKDMTKTHKTKNYVYMMDIISIMKSMDRSQEDIYKKLESEGYSKESIGKVIADLIKVEDKLNTLKKEDSIITMIKMLDADEDVIVRALRNRGFSEEQIHDAFKELALEMERKEESLRKDIEEDKD